MSDLVEFVLDRLAEDEHAARAATPGPWRIQTEDWYQGPVTWVCAVEDPDSKVIDYDPGPPAGMVNEADAAHIARHDPARVLADVAAKRRIIELHGHQPEQTWEGATITGDCRECIDEHYPCGTLRLLAQAHADHADYRPEWRP